MTPKKTLDIQDLGIVVAAKNLNPQVVNLDFLKLSGIIPSDWELTQQPVANPRVVQLTFQNGVSIVAQPGNITFSELIRTNNTQELNAPVVAKKCLEKLPNAEYQGVSISPKNVVAFGDMADAPRKYITGTLLAPGPWQELGTQPVQASINLVYQLELCLLTLNINQVRLQQPEKPATRALMFSGNFNYQVTSYSGEERLRQLQQQIDNWSGDLQTFREIINTRFLVQEETVFPVQEETVFPMG